MRTIQLEIDINKTDINVPVAKLFNAIGYLSTWNQTSYPKVVIYNDGKDANLIAHYYKENGSHGYTIGAVWHGDDYGFHS